MEALEIITVTDESVPPYVRSAAARDEKWEYVVSIPGCWQLLDAEQAQEIRTLELLGA
jgi:hypothetical protein